MSHPVLVFPHLPDCPIGRIDRFHLLSDSSRLVRSGVQSGVRTWTRPATLVVTVFKLCCIYRTNWTRPLWHYVEIQFQREQKRHTGSSRPRGRLEGSERVLYPNPKQTRDC